MSYNGVVRGKLKLKSGKEQEITSKIKKYNGVGGVNTHTAQEEEEEGREKDRADHRTGPH